MGLTDLFGDIADAIREKDGTTAEIVASTFPARIRAIPTGIGGVQLESISITAPPTKTLYVSGETFDPTGMTVWATYSNGQSMYVNHSNLTFDPSGPLDEGTVSVTVNFQWGLKMVSASQPVIVAPYPIFGVVWDYSNPSTALTRLTPETDPNNYATTAIALEPSPAIGTSSGSSPFDSYYPWKGVEEYNIIDGDAAYKRGDSGFSRAGYDTMVYIPEFYYKVIDDDTNQKIYWYVSSGEATGFEKHPGSGKYVGRYQAGPNYESKSGLQPKILLNRLDARTGCKSKGPGWSMYDYAAWCAVWLLYLVEFADWDSQSKLGYGITYGSIQANGATDSMVYHTGRAADEDTGNTAIQYRGIENPWGNILQWIDGINFNAHRAYICTNPDQYIDDIGDYGYADSGVALAQNSSSYIVKIGISSAFPFAFLPTISNGGSDTTYIPDIIRPTLEKNWSVLAVGGYPSLGKKKGGMFLMYMGYPKTSSYQDRGTRVQFNLIEEV